jgi:uncharacterized DUF497 family protein
MEKVYIGLIAISPAMAQKIMTKHGVTPEEVREACQAPNRYLRAAWHDHPEYGRRLIVVGSTSGGRVLKVILQPVDLTDGTFRLRTALAAGEGGTAS